MIKKTGVVGTQVQESITINKDLFVLGKVVAALADKIRKAKHVAYRDSKLTRILRESLGGKRYQALLHFCEPQHPSHLLDRFLVTLLRSPYFPPTLLMIEYGRPTTFFITI